MFEVQPAARLTQLEAVGYGASMAIRSLACAAAIAAAALLRSEAGSTSPRVGSAPDGGAGERAHARDGGAARTAEDAPCQSVRDCALTRFADLDCCPMLCEPRAVTKRRAEELERHSDRCASATRQACPNPLCRPTETAPTVACERGRCIKRITAVDPN